MQSRAASLNSLEAMAILLLSMCSAAEAQTTPDLKGQVIQSTAKILGTAEGSTGDGVAGLRQAQVDADRAFSCESPRRIVLLPGAVSNSVTQRIRSDLLAGANRSVVLQRPEYTAEIIATAIVSFELGRTSSMTEQERTALCNTPAPQQPAPDNNQQDPANTQSQ